MIVLSRCVYEYRHGIRLFLKKAPVCLDIHFYFNISGKSSPEFSQHFFLATFSDKREVMVAADPVPFYALANIKFNNVFNTCY